MYYTVTSHPREKGVQMPAKKDSESIVRDIKRKTRKKYNAEEKIRIVLDGLRGEESIAAICRREGIHPNLYYNWSKDFLEAGKKAAVGRHPTGSHKHRGDRHKAGERSAQTTGGGTVAEEPCA